MPRKTHALDLVDGLFQLSFLLHHTLARVAAEHDLSIIQVRLLGILRDREPAMLELARHLELEKSSLSGLVNRAEERGLVERQPSPDDGRAAHIRATAPGRRLSRLIEEEVTAEIAARVAVLSRSDREQLASLVSRVVTAADREDGRRPEAQNRS
jgi:MarR family transcriptional regulator, lower aerobic nicotinate degradation pathway regulator